MEAGSPELSGDAPEAEVSQISRDEIKHRLDDPTLIIVDVLAREAYAVEHIPRSINLPLAEIEERAWQMLPDRDAEIAAYCAKFT
jgi:rhodanese-related sulfurtransferase